MVDNILHKDLIKGVTVSRLTVPNDANVYGNVHGGTTLKLIEEAGIILSTKFCNYANKEVKNTRNVFTTMARIENVDFLCPMKIGEVVELTAEIMYTSLNSILVEVRVDAEDIIKATKKTTNRALLWYVAWDEEEKMSDVPQMHHKDSEELNAAKAKYSTIILENPTGTVGGKKSLSSLYNSIPELNSHPSVEREKGKDKTCCCPDNEQYKEHTPGFSETCLSMMVGINDVAFGGNMCKGGVFLKLMDECAGIVAAKHCRTNVVTACMDATNFYSMIRRGHLLTIHGKATFTSAKSMEVEVQVWVDDPFGMAGKRRCKSADAFFTYVSIDAIGKTRDVPNLVITSDEEQASFEAGNDRYHKRKEHRLKMKNS